MNVKVNVISERKKTGATFTPVLLADFLSKKLLSFFDENNCKIDVLDPSCGDGSLLLSICKIGHSRIKSIIGYDTNEEYLENARKAILNFDNNLAVDFNNRDFLTVCPNVFDLFATETRTEFADVVIANPPYIRTQVLGANKAQQLARDFNLSGRVDMYYPFLMAMTNALKKGGLLGVITSNRYLTTKSGSDIRKFLLDNFDIVEVIDLGDTKLFDAAVLPAIFIGRKKGKTGISFSEPLYSSIYESQSDTQPICGKDNVFEVLDSDSSGVYSVGVTKYLLQKGLLKLHADRTETWQISNNQNNSWIDTIHKNTDFYIGDKFKVRVGIKSCADNVFITQQWEREGCEIEGDLLKEMISQENINAWSIDRSSMIKILYPHYSSNNKRKVYDIEKYPSAGKYLEKHRQQLEGRSYLIKANRRWYEYWVPQNPELWNLPKVVFPDISPTPRFCFDESGAIVNGNCYWMCAKDEEEKRLLLLIEGVCNSDVMVKYHDISFNNKLYSGRRRYLTQYIEKYPVPNPNTEFAQDIIKCVEEINNSSDEGKNTQLKQKINVLVGKAFGF